MQTMRIFFVLLLGSQVLISTSAGQSSTKLGLATAFESNPFHVRESRKDSFDADRAPGSRYEGFEKISDLVATLEGGLSRRWKMGGGSRLEPSIGADLHLYRFNSIANYAELSLGVNWDTRSAGQTGLNVSWIPSRRSRNYRDPSGSAAETFRPAEFAEIRSALSYAYPVRSDLKLLAFTGLAKRTYDAPHSNRDQRAVSAGLGLDIRLARKTHLALEAALIGTSTDNGLESGIQVDRSSNATQLKLSYETTSVKVWARMRDRSYTTDEVRDPGHFNRSDIKWTVGTEWERRLTPELKMALGASYENNSSRRAPGLPSEDVIPYTDFSLGAGLSLSL